jgi:hypothetical protein
MREEGVLHLHLPTCHQTRIRGAASAREDVHTKLLSEKKKERDNLEHLDIKGM